MYDTHFYHDTRLYGKLQLCIFLKLLVMEPVIILGYYSSNPLAKLTCTRDNYNSWLLGHSSSNIGIEIPCWSSYPKLRKPLPLFILKPSGLEEAILQWSGKKFMLMLESRQWTSVAKNDGGTTIKSLNMLSLPLEYTCQRSHTSY